jgi:asparagine synthase (glutamine-hydrolysing)
MCGFTGLVSIDKRVNKNDLIEMTNSLDHRGPNSNGIWISESNEIGMGHTRLAILDTSDAGAQPMFSKNQQFILIFNGEIYNHLDLRKHLNSICNIEYSSFSDTETLLVSFEIIGIKETLKLCKGMFSLALFDQRKRTLTLCRDRIGEKPLYYGINGNYFYFGSELKSFKINSNFCAKVSENAFHNYLKFGYVPAPYSIYEGIYKLKPGNILEVSIDDINDEYNLDPFWTLNEEVSKAKINPFYGNDQDAINTLEEKLIKVVNNQMISDVPIGAFLSGGIDSSLIVAIMQSQSNMPINTFTIGFNDKFYNEAIYAKEISKKLNTKHTELYIDAKQIIDVIDKLPTIYDEPFADSSQLPTYMLSKLAQQNVSVCLSGDGGDEIFCGYNRYIQSNKFIKGNFYFRKIISEIIFLLSPKQIERFYSLFKPLIIDTLHSSNPVNHLYKIANLLKSKNDFELYDKLISVIQNVNLLTNNPINNIENIKPFDNELNFVENMMFNDTVSYLPDDILCKVDRSSMAVSLETRVPYLDHDLISYSWSLPMNMKIRNGKGKWVLRKLLNKYIPNELIDRPKIGFGIPLDQWLRHELRDWANELLNETDMNNDEFFNHKEVQALWREHLNGKRNRQHELWNILMFQSWKNKWL